MVPFSFVRVTRKNLQVSLNMQSADDAAYQRDDVIDLVAYASCASQSSRFGVDSQDRFLIRPYWRCLSLGGITPGDDRIDLVLVVFGPFLISLLNILSVRGSPELAVVLAMLFVPFMPFRESIWMRAIPLAALYIHTGLTPIRQSVLRRAIHVEFRERFGQLAHTATLQPCRAKCGLVGRFLGAKPGQFWLSNMGSTSFADWWHSASASMLPFTCRLWLSKITDRLVYVAQCARLGVERCQLTSNGGSPLSSVGRALFTVTVSIALQRRKSAFSALFVCHRLSSMWASMMRRTSSAMEMPSRVASFFRKTLCGSVNEIICLVTVVFLHLFGEAPLNATPGGRMTVLESLECRQKISERYLNAWRQFVLSHSVRIPQGIPRGVCAV